MNKIWINSQNFNQFLEEEQSKNLQWLQKRMQAPLLKLQLNEKRNVIVLDGQDDKYISVGFHYVKVTPKIGIKVMCGNADGERLCLLCELQKYYADKIKNVNFYGVFNVFDMSDKQIKLIVIPSFNLKAIYQTAYQYKNEGFLKGLSLSIIRVDRGYLVSLEFNPRTQRPLRYSVQKIDKRHNFFEYFSPFTVEELKQLGFDVSLVNYKKNILPCYNDCIELDALISTPDEQLDKIIENSEETKIEEISIDFSIGNDNEEENSF